MRILVDADALVGIFAAHDPHHKHSTASLKYLRKMGSEVLVLNLVLQEVATVLSHKIGQKVAVKFLDEVKKLGLQMVWIDEEIERNAWEIFRRQTKKGTSFVDCANMAIVGHYKLDGIFSFDRFYPEEMTKWTRPGSTEI